MLRVFQRIHEENYCEEKVLFTNSENVTFKASDSVQNANSYTLLVGFQETKLKFGFEIV